MTTTLTVHASQGIGHLEDRLARGQRAFVTNVERDGDRLVVTMRHPGTRADAVCTLALACRRVLMDNGLHSCALGVVDRDLGEAA